ncbi:unnamed protein product [Linum tenue]|uniref:Uncharacterized protein n=2 Tax=Linum tenue TaxID=586396 RepID=A0AAV0HBC7_9ROSI|nr:unnamed protein product [Linum tenue]
MEKRETKEGGGTTQQPHVTGMRPVTKEAYGGGMYAANETTGMKKREGQPPASDTQSADGPVEKPAVELKHPPPPSTGDRDLDITGQSYIQ